MQDSFPSVWWPMPSLPVWVMRHFGPCFKSPTDTVVVDVVAIAVAVVPSVQLTLVQCGGDVLS